MIGYNGRKDPPTGGADTIENSSEENDENAKGVTGIVLLGTTPPVFSTVGANGNIVDNNGIGGKIVDVGTGITDSKFVTKGLLKGMIPSGRVVVVVGPTGKMLWERFESGTGVIELIFMFVTVDPFRIEIGFTVEGTRSLSLSTLLLLRLGDPDIDSTSDTYVISSRDRFCFCIGE